MRETVCVHVGQCGNQIGSVFWDMLLHEHDKTADDDFALSSFFHFVPSSQSGKTHVMKARALLIDMECGVVDAMKDGPLGALFDHQFYINDNSGAGNNFAEGYYHYGPLYHDRIADGLRKSAEACESLQTYLVTHSLSGGTGSGVGSYLLGMLADDYPKVARFTTSVFPSEDNDVITGPYNTMLATKELIQHADCVFPIDNQALFNMYQAEHKKPVANEPAPAADKRSRSRGFDGVNAIAARMLCHLTASSRFHGEMNVDMNEIYTNLVPFPKLHFLQTSMNIRHPQAKAQRSADISHAAIQRAFNDLINHRGGHLTGIPPSNTDRTITLASAFICRGSIPLSDFIHGVSNIQKALKFPSWNQDACKIGMCGTAAPGESMAVMAVYNSTGFGAILQRELDKFQRLYRVKAHLHHYTKYVKEAAVGEAEHEVQELLADYKALEDGQFHGGDAATAKQQLYSEF